MGFESTFSKDVWHREATTIAVRNGIRTRRWGMRVTVYLDPNPADNGEWVLTYGQADTNRQSNDNWLKVADPGAVWGGGGGGGITTASNGLTVQGTNVVMGGPLDQHTTIDLNGGHVFAITGVGNIHTRVDNGPGTSFTDYVQDSTPNFLWQNENFPDGISANFGLQAQNNGGLSYSISNFGGLSAQELVNFQRIRLQINDNPSGLSDQIEMFAGQYSWNLQNSNLGWGTGVFVTPANYTVGLNTADHDVGLSMDAINNGMTLTVNRSDGTYNSSLAFADNTDSVRLRLSDTTVDLSAQIELLTIGRVNITATDGASGTSSSASFHPTGIIQVHGDNDISISSLTNLDFTAATFTLNGVAPVTPATEFFRADGTWAVPSGGGGGGLTTANNGLTATGTNVRLGGALTQNTTITGSFSLGVNLFNSMFFNALGAGNDLSMSAGDTMVFTANADLNLTSTTGIVDLTGNAITLDATTTLNLNPTGNILLNGVAPVNPLTQFLRGDKTWATAVQGPAGALGSIQFHNPAGQFAGEGDFNYDTSSNTMTIINGVNQMKLSGTTLIRYISGAPQMLLDNDELITQGGTGLPFSIHPSGNLRLIPDNGVVLIGTVGPLGAVLQSTSSSASSNLTIRAQGVAGQIIMDTLPTAVAGLPTGALWNNGGVLNIAP